MSTGFVVPIALLAFAGAHVACRSGTLASGTVPQDAALPGDALAVQTDLKTTADGETDGPVFADAGAPDSAPPGDSGNPVDSELAIDSSGPAIDSGKPDAHPPTLLWIDAIQTSGLPWGFQGVVTEHPIGVQIAPDDANGVNFSRVTDPLGGGGFALRQFATFDTGGSRAQAGLWSMINSAFEAQAKSAEGIWIAQEWYFPEALSANGDPVCWISVWDWHSTDPGGGNRWHTAPGLFVARDGSMRVSFGWGGPAHSVNPSSALSSIPLPVGRWFEIEMHYRWTTGTTTISLWIDGELALEQHGVRTRVASHANVETYLKFYGSTQGGGPWQPTPSLKFFRNVRFAGERIWR